MKKPGPMTGLFYAQQKSILKNLLICHHFFDGLFTSHQFQ